MTTHPQPTRATPRHECALDRMLNRTVDAVVREHADRGQALREAQKLAEAK
jgi:hypothetical protein